MSENSSSFSSDYLKDIVFDSIEDQPNSGNNRVKVENLEKNILPKNKKIFDQRKIIEKKIKFKSDKEDKYFNLFTSRDLKFEDLDEELSLEGVEDDLNSDEDVINEGKKKTIKELETGMKVFEKKKFNIINNYIDFNNNKSN